MDRETIKLINENYNEIIRTFRSGSEQAEPNSVVRDIYVVMKKTMKRLQRVRPTWRTMIHGVFGIDDDEMGALRIVVGTDVTYILTGEQNVRKLFTIDSDKSDKYNDLPIIGTAVDQFLNYIEIHSPNYMDDLLLATNYIALAENIGYKVRKLESGKDDNGDDVIRGVLTKKDRAIVFEFNMSTPITDVVQLHNHGKEQGMTN